MKLKMRLMYLNFGLILIVTTTIVSLLLYRNYEASKTSALEQIELVTDAVAKDVEDILRHAEYDTMAMADAVTLLMASGEGNRKNVIDFLERYLEENDQYLYTWAAFEPNAFDGIDSYHKNAMGSDDKGRFLPSWARSGDALLLLTCEGTDTDDYYQVPKKTGKFFVGEPATYSINGEMVTSISFCQPIIIDEAVVGVIGLDISLDTLREICNNTTFFETGYGRLISNKGTLLSHRDESKLGQLAEELAGEEGKSLIQQINSGKTFKKISETAEGKIEHIYSPISFNEYDMNWAYGAVVPYSEMMAEARRLIVFMVGLSILAVAVVGTITFLNSKYVVDTLMNLLDVIHRFAELNLTIDQTHPAVQYLKRKDETGDIAKAMVQMQSNFVTLLNRVQQVSSTLSISSDQLNLTSEEITRSVEEVSNTIEELANGASAQASETEAGAEKINDLGALMSTSEQSVEAVAQSAQSVGDSIEKGLTVMEKLSAVSLENDAVSKEVAGIVGETDASVAKIRKASEMIASIAQQTNLLSLNAAIEAARAGEAGKGFAVVAEEIRKLAEQSTASTQEIDSVVEEVIHNSSRAVAKMKEAESIAATQIESAKDTAAEFKEMSMAVDRAVEAVDVMQGISREMEESKKLILEVVQSLSAIAEENAASTEEVAASMEEQTAALHEVANASGQLSGMAGELSTEVTKFKI